MNKIFCLSLLIFVFDHVDAFSSRVKRNLNEQIPDISAGIVDLKFDGNSIKICEFGEFSRSAFFGFDSLYGVGSAWHGIWNYLASFNLPLWVVEGRNKRIIGSLEHACDTFFGCGGHLVPSLTLLRRNNDFCRLFFNSKKDASLLISDYKALIVFGKRLYESDSVAEFKHHFPLALFSDDAVFSIFNNKLLMNSFCEQYGFGAFRPRCKVYTKKSAEGLYKKIIEEFPCDYYVIKPINATKGYGIIITSKDALLDELKIVVKRGVKLRHGDDKTYSYWAEDKNNNFLLEEYVPSKTILCENHYYDPTMRVIFGLCHEKGKVAVTYLGSYWKLPSKGLDEDGSLTEKHKSHINYERLSSAKVLDADYEKVKEILSPVLTKMYEALLMHKDEVPMKSLR